MVHGASVGDQAGGLAGESMTRALLITAPPLHRRTVWTEVFINTKGKDFTLADYHGIYIGEEKIKRVRAARSNRCLHAVCVGLRPGGCGPGREAVCRHMRGVPAPPLPHLLPCPRPDAAPEQEARGCCQVDDHKPVGGVPVCLRE